MKWEGWRRPVRPPHRRRSRHPYLLVPLPPQNSQECRWPTVAGWRTILAGAAYGDGWEGREVRDAWKRGYYSEGQLARLLKLHRLEVRELLDGVETERCEADEVVQLPR